MAKCIERAESHCRSYPRCDGCGAYREPTNADRFREMSNQEQQRCVRRFWEIEDFADWLKQPVKDGEDE